MNVQDCTPGFLVGKREVKLPVEATRASQSWVNRVRPIGGADDNDLTSAVHTIHQGKQGGHDGCVNLVLLARSDRRKTIDLVEEDDAGLVLPCLLEKQSKLLLGLTDPFAQRIGTLAHVERDLLAVRANA